MGLARTWWLVVVWWGVAACGGSDPLGGDATAPDGSMEAGMEAAVEAGPVPDAQVTPPSVEVGVPAGSDGLGFAALEPGAELRLQTFGQGGTHLLLGVRTRGFGNRAYITITLRNLETGAEAVSPAPAQPQLLWCDEEGHCDLVPVLALAAGLVATGAERDGVEIEVEVTARNDAGLEASDVVRGVLSTEDL